MLQRFLISADDKKHPGQVVCTFISFETETIDVADYDAKRPDFLVLQRNLPESAHLRRLLADK